MLIYLKILYKKETLCFLSIAQRLLLTGNPIFLCLWCYLVLLAKEQPTNCGGHYYSGNYSKQNYFATQKILQYYKDGDPHCAPPCNTLVYMVIPLNFIQIASTSNKSGDSNDDNSSSDKRNDRMNRVENPAGIQPHDGQKGQNTYKPYRVFDEFLPKIYYFRNNTVIIILHLLSSLMSIEPVFHFIYNSLGFFFYITLLLLNSIRCIFQIHNKPNNQQNGIDIKQYMPNLNEQASDYGKNDPERHKHSISANKYVHKRVKSAYFPQFIVYCRTYKNRCDYYKNSNIPFFNQINTIPFSVTIVTDLQFIVPTNTI